MRRAQLLRLARWMQRIGEQQETIGQSRRFRGQHTGLPAAVGMPAQPDLFGVFLANLQDLLAQAFAISSGVAGAWWAVWPVLPEGQIVAHHLNTMFGKYTCQSHQQGCITIRSSAVGQQENIHAEIERAVSSRRLFFQGTRAKGTAARALGWFGGTRRNLCASRILGRPG